VFEVARLIYKSVIGGDATIETLHISDVAVALLFELVLRQ
jgi:hypothetical protein